MAALLPENSNIPYETCAQWSLQDWKLLRPATTLLHPYVEVVNGFLPRKHFHDFYSSLLRLRAGATDVFAFTFKERLAKMWCLVWVEGHHGKGKNLRNEENFGR